MNDENTPPIQFKNMSIDARHTKYLPFWVELYKRLMVVAVIFIPTALIAYLWLFIDPSLVFKSFLFHEISIAVACGISAFIGWVAYQNYKTSGDVTLRFISLAFVGFATVYSMHGVFTRLSDPFMAYFLMYGPTSRIVMSVYMLLAALSFYRSFDPEDIRSRSIQWWPHLLLFGLVNLSILVLVSPRVILDTF